MYINEEEIVNHISAKPFHLISEAAEELGVEVYVIGGYVRDIFLNRPSKDIDVVAVGSGIELAKRVAKKIGRGAYLSVFKNFGTAQVKAGDLELEFVGARKESYSHDSRKPVVEDGTLEDDQNRRDFTINALALCLNKERYGELVDPFGGLEDMDELTIRTPLDPDVTFSDDPLRMMRAVRFATQLGFFIDPDTFDAIIRNRERISIISKERIVDELNKIVLSPKPSIGFDLLDKCGLLPLIFPELCALKGVETKEGIGHKDNFAHTLMVLDRLSKTSDNLWLRWSALFHDIALFKAAGQHLAGHQRLDAVSIGGLQRAGAAERVGDIPGLRHCFCIGSIHVGGLCTLGLQQPPAACQHHDGHRHQPLPVLLGKGCCTTFFGCSRCVLLRVGGLFRLVPDHSCRSS